MIPKILEYEEGRIIITAEAFSIPEVKAIIDKHELTAEPYLAYIHLMTSPTSPYVNYPSDEKEDTIIYDVIQTHGDFDIEDDLLKPALDKFEKLYTSRTMRYFKNLCRIMDKVDAYAENAVISDENLSDITKAFKEAGATIRSFKDAEKQIDDELQTKMRGKNVLGDY